MAVSLLDLVPATRKVHGIPVSGLNAASIAAIVHRFEELVALFGKGSATAGDIVKCAPQAISAIIAAGIGKAGEEKQESAAALLPLEIQIDFLEGILEATFPNGVGPFADRIKRLMGGAVSTPQPIGPTDSPNKTGSGPSASPLPKSGKRITRPL